MHSVLLDGKKKWDTVWITGAQSSSLIFKLSR